MSKYGSGKKGSKAVKITAGLLDAIEEYLKTEKAELMGFRFSSDVVSYAVREMLIQQGFYDDLEAQPEGENEEEHDQ